MGGKQTLWVESNLFGSLDNGKQTLRVVSLSGLYLIALYNFVEAVFQGFKV